MSRTKSFVPMTTSAAAVILSEVYEIDIYARESSERIAYSGLTEPIRVSIRLNAPLLISS